MGRKISPVTERRRARRAARELCKAEGKRVKAWVPSERKRVAGLIVQMRAHGQQQLAQLRAQTAELIKAERAELGKRIKAARAAAKLGKCVDMTAGPQIYQYAYPKKPEHLKRGGQQRLFSTAPLHGGGKLGAPYRVRGEHIANEKAAHAAVLRHLKHDQGGIVVLELADGAGGYVDGPYYGLQGEGKAATLIELDPLDPHGHQMGRAQKHPRFGTGLRSILPTSMPPAKRSSAKRVKRLAKRAGVLARKPKGKVRRVKKEPTKRPPPRGSRAADPAAYDRRSRELVSEAKDAQRRATAHAKDMAKRDRLPVARTAAEGAANAFQVHEQISNAEAAELANAPDDRLRARLALSGAAALKAARDFLRSGTSGKAPPGFGAGGPGLTPKEQKRKRAGARTLLQLKTTQREGRHGLAQDWSFTWNPREEEGKVVIPFNHRGSARVIVDRSARPPEVVLYAYQPSHKNGGTGFWRLGDPETMTFPDLVAAIKAALKRPADGSAGRSSAYVDKR